MSAGAQVLLCGRSRDWYAFDLHEGRIHRVRGVAGRSEAGFSEIVVSPDGTMLTLTTESGALLLVSARTKQLVHTAPARGLRTQRPGTSEPVSARRSARRRNEPSGDI